MGRTSTEKRSIPGPSGAEQDVLSNLLAGTDIQLDTLEGQAELQKLLFEQFPGILQDVEDAFNSTEGIHGLSEEEKLEIATSASNSLRFGEAEIGRERDAGLRSVRDDIATSRGLRPGDSPILNEAGLVQERAQQQHGNLVRSVTADAANKTFSREQLNAELRQRAFQNRLGLASTASQIGLGLNPQVNIAGALESLQAPRLGSQGARLTSSGFDSADAIVGNTAKTIKLAYGGALGGSLGAAGAG